MQLQDRIAIVTGAGQGIGRGLALGLAAAGADVAVFDIAADEAERVAAEIAATGRRSLALAGDVSDAADVDRAVTATLAAFGRIDILVNNAAVTRRADIMELTEADWDRILRVNAKGTFLFLQRVAREMLAQGGGRIVNISSIGGKGFRGASNAAYAASKGAVNALTMLAASQLARHDITVNAVCPGATRGGRYDDNARTAAAREGIGVEELSRRRLAAIPLGRINEPEDVAAMVIFLASAGARNITGQCYDVDGGLLRG